MAIVTGGNTGIGLDTTKALAAAGATVIVPARDIEKAKKNLDGIPNVEIEAMDLFRQDTIDAIIQEALEITQQADVIVATVGEASEMSGESSSRIDIKIPAVQQRLLVALLKSGKPVVLVIFNGASA